MANKLLKDNANLLIVQGVKRDDTGAYINDANVTGNIFDDTGSILAGGPYTLLYVVNSNGDYQVIIPASLNITVNSSYYAIVDIVTTDNIKAKLRLPLIAKTRLDA